MTDQILSSDAVKDCEPEATAEPTARRRIDTLIVDADAHVNPSHDMWVDYLPASLRDLAPRIEHGEDADYVLFEGNRRKVNLINAQAGRTGKDFKMEGRVSDARSGGWMPAARLEDMDKDGMDAAVLFGGGPLGTTNNELYLASFDAYNQWLSDCRCRTSARRSSGSSSSRSWASRPSTSPHSRWRQWLRSTAATRRCAR